MKLVILCLFLFTAICSANETIQIKSKKGYKEQCFPVRLNKGARGHLDIHYVDYVPIDAFSFDQSVLVAVYRHRDVEKVGFSHNGKLLRVCDADAVNYGYCEQKHIGKVLFKYNDPQRSQGKLINLVLNDVNTYSGVFTFEETGYYCVATYSSSTKSYELTLDIIDGHDETLKGRNEKFASTLGLTSSLVTKGSLIGAWFVWSNFNVSKFPFQIKIVLADALFSIVRYAIAYTETHQECELFKVKLYQKIKSFLFDMIYPLFFSFYLYQFAISFAYRNPKSRYGAFHYISILFLAIGYYFMIPDNLLDEVFLQGYTLGTTLRYTIQASKGLLGFKILNEVIRTSEDYIEAKKGHEPRVQLFRAWIIFELINSAFDSYGRTALTFVFDELLKEVTGLRPYLFIDDSGFRLHENYDVTIAKCTIQAVLYSVVAFSYLSPSYYESVLVYHNIKPNN